MCVCVYIYIYDSVTDMAMTNIEFGNDKARDSKQSLSAATDALDVESGHVLQGVIPRGAGLTDRSTICFP